MYIVPGAFALTILLAGGTNTIIGYLIALGALAFGMNLKDAR